jgi:uncharacterized DUF497 family protein
MDIEFDPKKDASNLVKHGIRLARAFEFSPVAILEDTRKNYGEIRYRAFRLYRHQSSCACFYGHRRQKIGPQESSRN